MPARAGIIYAAGMKPTFQSTTPVLPAADTVVSLLWWTTICGFEETFRDATPPRYVGIRRSGAELHLAEMSDPALARTVGDQTMLRIRVDGVGMFCEEYQERGGVLHPNGGLQRKPWGTTEFATIDPNGVCVTFFE